MNKIIKDALVLLAITLVSGVALGRVYEVTKDPIAQGAEKAKQEQLAKEYEEKRQSILKSGKVSEVSKYKGQMTNQELSDALNRIRWEKELDKMSAAETKSNFEKVDQVMEKVGKVRNWANTAMDAYDTIATFHNFQHPDDKWDYIKKGNDKKKKKKDEDDD